MGASSGRMLLGCCTVAKVALAYSKKSLILILFGVCMSAHMCVGFLIQFPSTVQTHRGLGSLYTVSPNHNINDL